MKEVQFELIPLVNSNDSPPDQDSTCASTSKNSSPEKSVNQSISSRNSSSQKTSKNNDDYGTEISPPSEKKRCRRTYLHEDVNFTHRRLRNKATNFTHYFENDESSTTTDSDDESPIMEGCSIKVVRPPGKLSNQQQSAPSKNRSTKPNYLNCQQCNKRFSTHDSFFDHYTQVHNVPVPSNIAPAPGTTDQNFIRMHPQTIYQNGPMPTVLRNVPISAERAMNNLVFATGNHPGRNEHNNSDHRTPTSASPAIIPHFSLLLNNQQGLLPSVQSKNQEDDDDDVQIVGESPGFLNVSQPVYRIGLIPIGSNLTTSEKQPMPLPTLVPAPHIRQNLQQLLLQKLMNHSFNVTSGNFGQSSSIGEPELNRSSCLNATNELDCIDNEDLDDMELPLGYTSTLNIPTLEESMPKDVRIDFIVESVARQVSSRFIKSSPLPSQSSTSPMTENPSSYTTYQNILPISNSSSSPQIIKNVYRPKSAEKPNQFLASSRNSKERGDTFDNVIASVAQETYSVPLTLLERRKNHRHKKSANWSSERAIETVTIQSSDNSTRSSPMPNQISMKDKRLSIDALFDHREKSISINNCEIVELGSQQFWFSSNGGQLNEERKRSEIPDSCLNAEKQASSTSTMKTASPSTNNIDVKDTGSTEKRILHKKDLHQQNHSIAKSDRLDKKYEALVGTVEQLIQTIRDKAKAKEAVEIVETTGPA